MKKLVILVIISLVGFKSQAQSQNVSISQYGAVGDGKTLNTEAIQKAIDVQFEAGGGTVLVPPGVFKTGTIYLKSNINLHLTNGAVLLGSEKLSDYGIYSNGNQLGMIFAQDAENISITGFGMIDGNGRAYVYPNRVKDLPIEIKQYTRQGMAYLDTLKGIQDGPVVPFERKRPYQMVLMSGVKNLHMRDVTFADSPFWGVHVADSDGITITGVRVRNSLLMANADGLNFTSSSNIVISNCDIIAGDDALAFSGYSVHHELPGYRNIRRTSENVTVSNCLLQTRSAGIRVGGIDQNDLKNYRFDNISIYGSNRGIGIFVHQDGSISDIHFSNMTIQTRLHSGDWWGNGEPIHISVIEGAPVEKKLGTLKNVSFTNISAESEQGILVYGDDKAIVEQIRFRNIHLFIKNGLLQDEYGGNFDLRPTTALSKNLFKHDIPGIYLKNASFVSLSDVHVNWEANMHKNFKHGLWLENVQDLEIRESKIRAPRKTDLELYRVNSTLVK
jgi:polygalacturonase